MAGKIDEVGVDAAIREPLKKFSWAASKWEIERR
jgi:hypothetical protein